MLLVEDEGIPAVSGELAGVAERTVVVLRERLCICCILGSDRCTDDVKLERRT